MGLILDEIEFRFWGCWVDFLSIFVMFDDISAIRSLEKVKLEFWFILLGIWDF